MLCLARVCCATCSGTAHSRAPHGAPSPTPIPIARAAVVWLGAGCRAARRAFPGPSGSRLQGQFAEPGPGPRPEGMRALRAPSAPRPGQPPNTCAVLPHLAAAPPEPSNRNQNQGPSRPRAGPSLVVYILQAASATAVDVNRAPRPAGGANDWPAVSAFLRKWETLGITAARCLATPGRI